MNVLNPSTATLSTLIVTVSDRSTSVTVSVPLSVSVVSVSVSPVLVSLPVITGASSVPVMVISTCSVAEALLPALVLSVTTTS